MKNLFALFALILFFGGLVNVSAQTNADIFGYYFIEKAPRAFADISEIHLAGNYGAEQKPPFHGLIRLKSKAAKDFHLNKPMLEGKNLTFTTKAVNGISYHFTGVFAKLDNFPENPPQGMILQGKLTKLKGKTKLSVADVKFRYEPGD